MTKETNPRTRIREFFVGSVVTGIVVTFFLGLVTSPAVALAAQNGPEIGGYAVLAVFSLGILVSQFSVWNDAPEDGFAEYEPVTQAILVSCAVLYFNAIVAVAVWLGAVAGGAALGGTVALVFPLYDRWIVRRGVPLSLAVSPLTPAASVARPDRR